VLGVAAERVEFADMDDVGGNPARIIPAWQDFVAAHPGRRLRGIGEPIHPHRSPAELVECQHHERLLNLALDGAALTLLCPYDTEALPADVVDEAHRSHPLVAENGDERTSESYAREQADGLLGEPLPAPPEPVRAVPFTGEDLPAIRALAAERADDAGLSAEKRQDLVLALHELATNSVRHGGGAGRLAIWSEPGELVCEIRDGGFIEDPLVDRRRPPGDRLGGYGLWLANQLCDLVQLRTGASGSVARVHMRLG